MNVNVYLPDDLGQRAKDAELPLSRLLRDAVTDELERRKAVAEALTETREFILALEDEEGRGYVGRLTGHEIVSSGESDVSVLLRERDGKVVVYDVNKNALWEIEDPEEELREWLPPALYSDAMHALGIKPVIDL